MIRVSEMFGPTIQGEGPTAGRRAAFLRTVGCNLDCSWCDTPYTWDWARFDRAEQTHDMPEGHAVNALGPLGLDTPGTILVLTGGEPLTQTSSCSLVAAMVRALYGSEVWVETNGTRPPLSFTDVDGTQVYANHVVSPKLASSRVAQGRRYRPARLQELADVGAHFKFVACSAADLDAVDEYVAEFGLAGDKVWVMPEGTSPDAVLDGARKIVDAVVERGWNLSLRSHTLLWGDERCR